MRSLQTDIEQLKSEIKDKQQHLITIEEQRQTAESDAEARRRELDLQGQQLRSDAEADGRKLLGLGAEVRKTQQELNDLQRQCRAAKEERVRLEECVQGDLRKIDQEKNDKEEQLHRWDTGLLFPSQCSYLTVCSSLPLLPTLRHVPPALLSHAMVLIIS